MTDIRDRAGAKWFAGLMLASLILSMGNGLALSARAQEVPPDAPTENSTSTSDTQDGEPIDESSAKDGGPGEDGENGNNGDEPPPSDGVPTDITTGNASAGASAGGIVNVTDIDTNASSTSPASTTPSPIATTTATSTPPGGIVSDQPAVDPTSTTPDTSSVTTPENPGSASANIDTTQNVVASTTIHAEGNTGANKITDPDGGEINTGDGDIWAQDHFFFNIALIDSSLQVKVLLNPTESELDFRNQLLDFFTFGGGDQGSGCVQFYNCKKDDLNATTTNSALLERDMAVLCNSGENYGGLINTGNCNTSGVMTTMGNWFAFNSNLMVLLVNQIGDMNADVVLPEPAFFENMRKGTIGNGTTLDIEQNASTTITGESLANSGGNFGEEGVWTGEAEADAATINMINQLNPLSCFIIAVGGTWNGEVYQLPQGFQAQDMPFGKVICGRGGATGNVEAINAVVKNDLEMVVNALVSSNTGTNAGESVATGNARSFLTILNMVNTVFINQDWMLGLFTVSGNWNGDLTFGARPGASPQEQAASDLVSGKKSKKRMVNANATLTKTSSTAVAISPSAVEYTLTLKNNGGDIRRAVLEDTLVNPLGAVVNTQRWELGTVLAGEEIVVNYTVEFNGTLPPGNYTNKVKLTGQNKNGVSIRPIYASVTVELMQGEVLGVEECPAYLTSYIVPGGSNNPEQVRLLEVFLRDGRGEVITPDGTYDAASIEAVKRFQTDYAEYILAPWGIGEPTGHVYYTTRKTINELYCNGDKNFPLSSFQVQQIELYRNGVLQDPTTPVGVIPLLNPWSATDLPLISEFNLLSPLATHAPSTMGFFNWASPFSSHPLLTLLFDIFSQIASGFSVGTAQAAR